MIFFLKHNKIKKFFAGGYMIGKSHDEGGILIEVEGGEAVINKKSTNAKKKLLCKGYPKDILGSINYMEGGKPFGNDLNACDIVDE